MSKTTILYKDIAPGAAESASFSSSQASELSALSSLAEESEMTLFPTLEQNEWLLNGQYITSASKSVPFWSEMISDSSCFFVNPPSIRIELGGQYSSPGLTLIFGPHDEDYCPSFNIKWYQQNTLKAEANFSPTQNICFCHQNVVGFDSVVIKFYRTKLPYHYLKLYQIIFGCYRAYGMEDIRSAKIVNQFNEVSLEVPVSTLNWELEGKEDINYMFQLKQPIEVKNDDCLIGIYYIDKYNRSSNHVYSIDCHDAIGILEESQFAGGVYTNFSAKQLLKDVIGSEFLVLFEEGIVDKNLNGILEKMSKREALQQIAFAWGVCLATDGSRGVRVFSLADSPEEISIDKTFTGTSVSTESIVTRVEVVAHTYMIDSSGPIEINGSRYKDVQTVFSVTNPNVAENDKQREISIKNATLVSPNIGQETVERIYDFYTKRNKLSTKIIWEKQWLGDCITLPNPWGSTYTGHLSKAELIVSNTMAANCEVLS